MNVGTYKNANPFPHIILDNLFLPEILNQVLDEFPSAESDLRMTKYDHKTEVKSFSIGEKQLGEITKTFMHLLNSEPFLNFLATLTGIENLVPSTLVVMG